jgi:ligand-binding sensor domain-containing protein
MVRLLAVITIVTTNGLALDSTRPAGSYIRDDFTVEEGLPSNIVNAIAQTPNGFLWLGTDQGLATFPLKIQKAAGDR